MTYLVLSGTLNLNSVNLYNSVPLNLQLAVLCKQDMMLTHTGGISRAYQDIQGMER